MYESDYQIAAEAIGTDAVDALAAEYRPATPRGNGGRTACLSVPMPRNLGRKRGDSTIGARIVSTIGLDKAHQLSEVLGGEIIWLANKRIMAKQASVRRPIPRLVREFEAIERG